MVFPVGFWINADGPRPNTFVECGCCGHYHRTDFFGDCREDSERFTDETLPADAKIVDDDIGDYIKEDEDE